MRWDVDELARAAGVRVDTVRYYQTMGLLPPPTRQGRHAFYDATHLDRLERIRALAQRGFSLRAIRAVLADGDLEGSDRLLLGAVEQEAEDVRFSSQELAERTGVSREILAAVERAGLVEGDAGEREGRYSAADLRAARAGAKLLRHGFPLLKLLRLALKHDRATRKTVEEAIDLFDAHIRKAAEGREADAETVANAFRELLPAVTAVVAHHFQRTLVNRALARLRRSGERRAYRAALEASGRSRRKRGA